MLKKLGFTKHALSPELLNRASKKALDTAQEYLKITRDHTMAHNHLATMHYAGLGIKKMRQSNRIAEYEITQGLKKLIGK